MVDACIMSPNVELRNMEIGYISLWLHNIRNVPTIGYKVIYSEQLMDMNWFVQV